MSDDFDWPQLARYLSGMCTADEARAMDAWLAERPARQRELALLREAWHRGEQLPIPRHANAALARVLARRGMPRTASHQESAASLAPLRPAAPRFAPWGSDARARWHRAALPVAAAIVLGVIAITWGRHAIVSGGTTAAESLPAHVYATQRAQRAVVRLADGTQVTLGPASWLSIPAAFGRETRTVELEGEGYFDVVHDARHPFRVVAGTTTTEDVGTAFMVRDYAADTATTVVVAEGRVMLRARRAGAGGDSASRAVALSAGQLARVGPSGGVTVLSDVDLAQHLAWLRGRLVYHGAPLAAVRQDLERWYDVRIDWSDSTLAGVPVTASFDDVPVDDVLRALGRLLDAHVTRHGATVRLIPNARTP
ncbi:MAG: FecR domain-containing protein [Gemmatimonadaceae bacterium]|nr:FecR domain-containing protein [Gemmatimonadaceae bacterium]